LFALAWTENRYRVWWISKRIKHHEHPNDIYCSCALPHARNFVSSQKHFQLKFRNLYERKFLIYQALSSHALKLNKYCNSFQTNFKHKLSMMSLISSFISPAAVRVPPKYLFSISQKDFSLFFQFSLALFSSIINWISSCDYGVWQKGKVYFIILLRSSSLVMTINGEIKSKHKKITYQFRSAAHSFMSRGV
jgi:hypothetical protein